MKVTNNGLVPTNLDIVFDSENHPQKIIEKEERISNLFSLAKTSN